MTYLEGLIKAGMKSIPGYRNPDIFNISVINLEVVNGSSATVDERGNPIIAKVKITIKAIFTKKPRINDVTQKIDAISNSEPFEGNITELTSDPPLDEATLNGLLSKALGEVTADANINGVQSKIRLVSIGKDYLEAYNKTMGRVIQIKVVGGALNV